MSSLSAIVDLDAAYAALDSYRGQLRARGVAVIPGFVSRDGIAAMVAECDALAVDAYHEHVHGTPYLELPSDDWPDGHPRKTLTRTSVHTVGYDQFPSSSLIRQLFESEAFLAFVSQALGRAPLYRYADPIGALNVAVMVDGDELGWHYDQTDFVVSLAIQSSEAGGHFENVAFLRGEDGDENYDVVAEILRGDGRARVVTEPMTPGTLMLFEGRRSLHQVTPITGVTPRYVALFGYDTKPDTMSSDLLKQVRYGRTEPLHAPR